MSLNEQEKTSYLANVLRVAFADKTLSARETAALEEIRKGIDAKKTQLTAAQKAVEASSNVFIKVGSFADQVRNLEDMLFVSLTDTDLNDCESQLVKEFCSLIGVYQEQLDKLIADTSRRCDSAEHTITCPSCSKSVQHCRVFVHPAVRPSLLPTLLPCRLALIFLKRATPSSSASPLQEASPQLLKSPRLQGKCKLRRKVKRHGIW